VRSGVDQLAGPQHEPKPATSLGSLVFAPSGVAMTPDGKTAFVTNTESGTVSKIDVKTRTKDPTDITVGRVPGTGVEVANTQPGEGPAYLERRSPIQAINRQGVLTAD
jgi:YVTN family beta-propeller protein